MDPWRIGRAQGHQPPKPLTPLCDKTPDPQDVKQASKRETSLCRGAKS